ncbi:MAG: helix-turn-helix domain-containing protein [Thermoguttaceae bacterium]
MATKKTQNISDQARKRVQGGKLLQKGYAPREIADILGVDTSTVYDWKNLIEKNGFAALVRKPGSGRQSKLTAEQKTELVEIIDAGAIAAGYENECWNSARVSAIIARKYNKKYSVDYIRQLLKQLGVTYKKPKSHSPKRS